MASVENGSDSVIPLCWPCRLEKKNVKPRAYCENCKEYLCSDCVQFHQRVTVTRFHSLLIGDRMPLDMSLPVAQDVCSDMCPKHRGKILEHFCEDEKLFCCSVCVTKDHRGCRDVTYIPEAAETILESTELRSLMDKLRDIDKLVNESKSDVAVNLETIKRFKTRALMKVQKLRAEIDGILNKLEKELRNNVDEVSSDDATKIKAVSKSLNTMATDLNAITSDLEKKRVSKEACQLFVAMKKAEMRVAPVQNDLEVLRKRNQNRSYYFQLSEETSKFAETMRSFGKLSFMRHPKETRTKSVKTLNVHTSSDTQSNCISSIIKLSESHLIAVDCENKCIKMIDMQSDKVVSTLMCSSTPWGATKVSDMSIAVTLPQDAQIKIVSFEVSLQATKSIKVAGNSCHGIVYCNETLVITFVDKPMVQIINMDGVVLKTIQSDKTSGAALFDNPSHVALSPDNDIIYVSDLNKQKVICLTKEGDIWAEGKEAVIRRPTGMAVDCDGNVFVCANWSGSVQCLTPDCAKGQPIIGLGNHLSFPESAMYSDVDKSLYVGSWKSDVIQVIQLEYVH